MIKKIFLKIREYILLGILALAPVVLTFWLLSFLFRFVDGLLPPQIRPYPGAGFLTVFFIIFFFGILTKTFAGRFFTQITDSLLTRLPVVKAVYPFLKQLSHSLFSNDQSASFKRVVYINFFSQDCEVLAFVTGELDGGERLVLFVPTAPNPTSGYVVTYPSAKVRDSSLTIDQALKVIVSCGSNLNRRSATGTFEKA